MTTAEYFKHNRTKSKKAIDVELFEINSIPVCVAWWGCKDHKREACKFMLQRHFGTVLVCGLTGNDLEDGDVLGDGKGAITPVPENCPLRGGRYE